MDDKPPLPPEVLEFFKKQGSKGGKLGGALAWEGLSKEERSERARQNAKGTKKKAKKKTAKKK